MKFTLDMDLPAPPPFCPMTPTHIPGEYPEVAAVTERHDLMVKASLTPVTKYEAAVLVKKFSPKTKLFFYPESRGIAWPLTRMIALPDMEGVVVMYPGGERPVLRLGVVLHEIAHISCVECGHGTNFVKALDRLLQLHYYPEYAPVNIIA